jgi:hypothetical protein
LVDLELGSQRLGVSREAGEILLERRVLSSLFSKDHLVVDQVEEPRGTGRLRTDTPEIRLDQQSLPTLPAIPVILDKAQIIGLAPCRDLGGERGLR